ncbi:extracellular serine-rich protein [Fonsecaea pedrosoi]|nr:extracellular serine-rich protein [Fonsecaea pedrosoi]
MRRSIALFLGLAALASAQDTATPTIVTDASTTTPTDSVTSAPATTSSSTSDSADSNSATTASSTTQGPITHTVAVALGGFTFVPDVTLAKVGDTILFQFYPTNHSVIRSEYGYACIPYEDTGVDKVGFFSGFKPVDAILSEPPEWSIVVNDTNPIFYYCGAPGSCIDHQMVGVINPNATTSLQHQKDLASQSQFMLLPGQPWPDESEDPFTTASATTSASATASPTGAGSSSETTASEKSSSKSGLSGGAIAGIAIGGAAVALAAAVALYLCGRQSRARGINNKNIDDRPNTGHATQVSYNPQAPHGHLSYMTDPTKHMSMHSSVVGLGPSPALPGYVPSHDPTMSPPLHPAYPMPISDSLSPGPMMPGSELASPHSPSPSQMYAVPAYSSGVPQSM